MAAKSKQEYADWYSRLTTDELINEVMVDAYAWANDRCVGSEETEDSDNDLAARKAELHKRLTK